MKEQLIDEDVTETLLGREIFARAEADMVQELKTLYPETEEDDSSITLSRDEQQLALEAIKHIYIEQIYTPHKNAFSHYYRNLFYITKFVHNSPYLIESGRKETDTLNIKPDKNESLKEFTRRTKTRNKKYEYLKILRSQLSNSELFLIAVNGLTDYGKDFYKYIEEYRLIKNLGRNDLGVIDLILLSRYPNNFGKP